MFDPAFLYQWPVLAAPGVNPKQCRLISQCCLGAQKDVAFSFAAAGPHLVMNPLIVCARKVQLC